MLLREIEELSCPWKIISPVETWPEIGNSVADNPGDGSGTLFAEKTYLLYIYFPHSKENVLLKYSRISKVSVAAASLRLFSKYGKWLLPFYNCLYIQ